jgi:hypothetical protein
MWLDWIHFVVIFINISIGFDKRDNPISEKVKLHFVNVPKYLVYTGKDFWSAIVVSEKEVYELIKWNRVTEKNKLNSDRTFIRFIHTCIKGRKMLTVRIYMYLFIILNISLLASNQSQ